MGRFSEIIDFLDKNDYKEKRGMLEYLLSSIANAIAKPTAEEKAELAEYVHREVERLIEAIPNAGCYRESDTLFLCENFIIGLILNIYGGPAEVPTEKLERIRLLTDMVKRERYVEDTVDRLYEMDEIGEGDVRELLNMASGSEDEFRKAKLYAGLIAYRSQVTKLTAGARLAVTEYFERELERYLAMDPMSEDARDALEVASDACLEFSSERICTQLHGILAQKPNSIAVYALMTLLKLGESVSREEVSALAEDVVYASMAYGALAESGKAELFPAELADEVYLAKSDMVHWLTYPTELGRAPDRIEYVGRVGYLFKRKVYHVFKYCSDSDNLGDGLKGKWLIGWSSRDGGTFSNFDLYELFEKDSVSKTLKNIKRKLIG